MPPFVMIYDIVACNLKAKKNVTVTFVIPYLENDQEQKSVIAHFSAFFNPFILAQLGARSKF